MENSNLEECAKECINNKNCTFDISDNKSQCSLYDDSEFEDNPDLINSATGYDINSYKINRDDTSQDRFNKQSPTHIQKNMNDKLNEFNDINIDTCKDNCFKNNDCKSILYMNPNNKCRLYNNIKTRGFNR